MSVARSVVDRVLAVRPVRRLAARVVRRLPAGVQRQLRSRLGRHRSASVARAKRPKLSIIVPVYNVEEYIAGALDSLLAQTLTSWEAVVVDDGSTDRSAAIVTSYAAADARIRVIRQDNAGLGAARNAGIRQARGQFLTFLDADDLIPPRAYKTAVEALRKSGSDFAIGATQRIQGTKRYSPAWSSQLHARARRRVTVDDVPEVMMDVIAGNRVFNAAFWRERIGEFPINMAYEDHRVMVTALIRATSFDLLSTVTYLWRVRNDGASISQQKMNLQNLLDRIRAHEEAFALLCAEASPTGMSAWLTRVLDIDVPLFADHTATADDGYRDAAQAFARRYVALADAQVWAGVRWHQRVRSLLMSAGRWADLEQFGIDLREHTGVPGTVIKDGQVCLDMSRWGEDFEELLADRDLLGERHTRLFARVDHQEWTSDGLRLRGFAYIAHVEPDRAAMLRLTLVNQRTGAMVAVPPAAAAHSGQANAFANHQYFDYSSAGFNATLDWDLLVSLSEPEHDTPSDSWELCADLVWHGIARSAPVDTTRRHGSAGALRSELVAEHAITIGPIRVNGALRLEARRIFAALQELHADGDRLAGRITVPPRDGYVPTTIACGTNRVPLHRTTGGAESSAWAAYTFDGLCTFDGLDTFDGRPGRPEPDRLNVAFSNGERRNLVWTMASVDPQILPSSVARRSHFGFVDIFPSMQCLARTTMLDDDALTVQVQYGYELAESAQQLGVALHAGSTTATIDADAIQQNDGSTATVTFDLNRRGPDGRPLRGTYHLCAGAVPVVPAEDVLSTLPETALTDSYRVELLRVPASQNGALTVRFGPPLTDQEQGTWAQSQLKDWFQTQEFEPAHAALFQCYRGESATDSQRAIHEELLRQGTDLTLYWGIEDGTVAVPKQGVPVIIGSAQWYRLLGSVKYLCNNIDFDRFFFRREHQRFLQTFHGHPFKAMGKSYWQTVAAHGPLSVAHEARRRQQLWTAAVMPNTESGAYYAAEYGLERGQLVTGYPRTDAIVAGDAAAARQRIACAFDIPLRDSRWVLYAPTWRETSATGTWSATLFDDLNLSALADYLDPGWTILVRGHNHNARENARVSRQKSVIDVTDWPEINDLILSADAAVLDYSSLRFDWAITRKPMVFFVPDKAEYLGMRPGLFDFDESAPGRQVVTTQAVGAALQDCDHYETEYGGKLDAFNARFNPLADGRAAERVVDEFFAPTADMRRCQALSSRP
jgi:CDP-glycerol glycerophosphotransferase